MAEHAADIVILGGGIAGLWTLAHLRGLGHDALLLEPRALGAGQTIAAQGIIHSGLKYALAGKISGAARSISAMPELWRGAMRGEGPVKLPPQIAAAQSQSFLIPPGMKGALTRFALRKALAGTEILKRPDWPREISASGFHGSVALMKEMVLDIPALLSSLAGLHAGRIGKIDWSRTEILADNKGNVTAIKSDGKTIRARVFIIAGAAANAEIARRLGHAEGMHTQERPLLMAMMKNAPFDLYAHLAGFSPKPEATVTTHRAKDGARIWYIGGGVAERAKESDPAALFADCRETLRRYMPGLDFAGTEWAALPVDRIEARTPDSRMPDLPALHKAANVLYAWPTKLTFAPLLAQMLVEEIEKAGISPAGATGAPDFLPPAEIAQAPWDKAEWKKEIWGRQG